MHTLHKIMGQYNNKAATQKCVALLWPVVNTQRLSVKLASCICKKVIYLFIIALWQVCQGSASNWCLQPETQIVTIN